MASITPSRFQTELPQEKFIISHKPEGDDVVPFDVVFVGAGPAGLAGAIELKKLTKASGMEIEIGVLEKAATLGGHSLSGACVNPVGFRTLFPELKDSDFPFRRPVTSEKVFLLSKSGKFRIPTPPTMQNHGYYVASLSEAVRWLGQKAEALGVNIMPGFPVDSLLTEGNRVVGVRTTPAGLKRDSQPGSSYMPPTDIAGQVVVLTDGTRSPLAQAYMEWQNIQSKYPQIFALGVKEIWQVKKAPDHIVHTLGWPLPKSAFGGSFMYPMADDHVALGIVGGLDYPNAKLDMHLMLQHLKTHPMFKEVLDGGKCVEWGAKTIPEGGYHSLPSSFSGDGLLMAGDCVGLVNVPALKGIHYAMMSGIFAARAIFKALQAGDTSKAKLAAYDEDIKTNPIFNDIRETRNMRHAFKEGFFMGGFKSVLMTLTKGAFPGDADHAIDDADEPKNFDPPDFPTAKVGISKVDAVYLSGNKTRDDIPSHLTVGKDVSGEVADMYAALCPAGVYERQGDKLIVNAPNCVDCKATDVIGPRWQPREGGSGPDYKQM